MLATVALGSEALDSEVRNTTASYYGGRPMRPAAPSPGES